METQKITVSDEVIKLIAGEIGRHDIFVKQLYKGSPNLTESEYRSVIDKERDTTALVIKDILEGVYPWAPVVRDGNNIVLLNKENN